MTENARVRATEIARTSYGKLISIVASATNDITAAEDFLSFAFQRALERWPEDGVPKNPEGWLVLTAKNKYKDELKSAAYKTRAHEEEASMIAIEMDEFETDQISDRRLALMFACAHPAIDSKVHTALILQTVLGLETRAISQAFAVPESAMAQRLVRAKRKIKAARIPFTLPSNKDIPARLDVVMEAIYASYAAGWEQDQAAHHELADEALYLSDILIRTLPDAAEAYGLAALLSYSVARLPANSDGKGAYIPLIEQSTDRWDAHLITRADKLLARSKSLNSIGRFQLEAAIQSVHCDRKRTSQTDWLSIVQLYEGLVRLYPTLGASIARASALGYCYDAVAGLDALSNIDHKLIDESQAFWAVTAQLQAQLGESDKAIHAYRQAIRLTKNQRFIDYLIKQCDLIKTSNH